MMMKARLLLTFAAVPISSAALGAAGKEKLGGLKIGNAAASARMLQDVETCDEDTIFVDSRISDLGDAIGGCYQTATTLLGGFPFYSLGGGASVGQAWIYVGDEGSWKIGIIEEVDEASGDVMEIKSVCTSEGFQAGDVSGPTDSQLEGAWQCVYFQDGVTNRLPGDFTGVECDCAGRTAVSVAESGGGADDTTVIAIAVLVSIAVLAALVCGCFIRIRTRRAKAAKKVEAPNEDHGIEMSS